MTEISVSRSAVAFVTLLLAACAANTPAQNLAYDSIRACRPRVPYRVPMVQPTGVYGLGVDPGTPSEAYHFDQCVRPYFAARALEGIAQPGPDAPAVQRQAYADLDECLQRATLAHRNGPNILVVRPPVIRITALNTDGTSLWAGDDWAEPRLTVCMRGKGYSVDGDRAYPPGTTR